MKKSLLSVLIFLSSLYVTGQPAFTAANCFQMGDSATMGYATATIDLSTFVPQTGGNCVWDFSSNSGGGPWLTWNNLAGHYLIRPGSASSYVVFQPFPLNEFSSNVPFGPDRMFAYSAANDTLYLKADVFGGNAMAVVNPQPYLSFPMNYQDSTSSQTAIYFMGVSLMGQSNRSWKYDGFGTVKLPYRNFSNVYRIHTWQRDTNFLLASTTISEELIWFEQSTGVPILRFTRNGANINVYYADTGGSTTGLPGDDLAPGISIGPIPFRNTLNLKLPADWGTTDVRIRDMAGKELWHQPSLGSGQLDLSGFAAGNYVLSITSVSTGATVVRKISKASE